MFTIKVKIQVERCIMSGVKVCCYKEHIVNVKGIESIFFFSQKWLEKVLQKKL
jgi:hypothetical protein